MTMEIKNDATIFFLNRSAWNPNNLELLVVECKVRDINGNLVAEQVNKKDWSDIKFSLAELAKQAKLEKYIFPTREAALEVYNKEMDEYTSTLHSKSKQELLRNLFRSWVGENILDVKVIEAMKSKIEKEFGVQVD